MNILPESELTPYQQELLTVLMEECGETVQEICKVFRFGLFNESHHYDDHRSHLTCLSNEIGDIMGMVELLTESGIGLNKNTIAEAAAKKREKVIKWMTHSKNE